MALFHGRLNQTATTGICVSDMNNADRRFTIFVKKPHLAIVRTQEPLFHRKSVDLDLLKVNKSSGAPHNYKSTKKRNGWF